MKLLKIKILFMGLAVLVFLTAATYLFLLFKGKAILARRLQAATQKQVSIGYFCLRPPFHIEIKNLEIDGLLKADSISISPSIIGCLADNIALNEVKLVKPEFTYEIVSTKRTASAPAPAPTATSTNNTTTITQPQSAPSVRTRRPLRLIAKRINIKEGRLNFIDYTVSEEGIKIAIQDISFNLDNLVILPRSAISNFEFKGKIPWQQGAEEGAIEVEGWLNLFKKDMQAILKIENIDGIYLYPYYQKWVDFEKARIEKAKLNFTSYIQGFNNDVTANCHLELTDIVFRPRQLGERVEKAEKIATAVLDIFKALNQGKIVLDFPIKTKMDRPRFGFGDIKMAFEDKLAKATKAEGGLREEGILRLPAKFLEEAVRGIVDTSKAVISGTFAIGNEFKKAIEEAFKKEKKE